MNFHPYLRSRPSDQHSLLTLKNCSERTVDVIWIGYDSKLVHYAGLPPGCGTPLNTFRTHPWIFKDQDTGEPMHVNNADIFWPHPWTNEQTTRNIVLIHLPMRSLRTIAMWKILSTKIKSVSEIALLELPLTLKYELFELFKSKYSGHFRIRS